MTAIPSYHQYYPSPALAEYIECYWTFHSPGDSTVVERLIPGGRIEMIFNFAHALEWLTAATTAPGISNSDTEIMGHRNQIFFARRSGEVNLLGIRFKPGGIHAFTSVPASLLLNQFIPAENVMDFPLTEWKSRLQEIPDDGKKIELLNMLLTAAIRETRMDWTWASKAVRAIQTEQHFGSIQELCSFNGGYYKKLERSFLRYVGYTPKYYSRIVRFNKALRQLSLQSISMTSAGYACGYFDQSHFIKDFRQFAGTTPKNFLKSENLLANLLIRNQAL
jgi:AraC-like DNA-binding protein